MPARGASYLNRNVGATAPTLTRHRGWRNGPVMDDTLLWLFLVPAVVIGGWVLGIRGYVLAKAARADIARLRAALEAAGIAVPQTSAPSAAFTPPPVAARDSVPASAPAPATDAIFDPVPVPVEEELRPASPPAPARPQRSLEELLTLRWGVWLGAGALLLSAVFLIRYAVEEGYLGPEIRTTLAALLGFALIGAAEFLYRRPAQSPWPDHAPGALAAGGAAALFGAAYAAASLYALVPPVIGFILMALAGMAGLLLSLRFGPVAAAVGVAGAFVTPMLVDSTTPNLPLLFAYLLAVTAAAMAVVRYTAWTWLGWAAAAAGALWVAVVSVSIHLPGDAVAPALFVPASAALTLALLPQAALDHVVGRRLAWMPFAALGASGLLLGLATGTAVAWWGVLLMSLPAFWTGRSEPRLDRMPWLAAGLGVLALLLWAVPHVTPTGEAVTIEGAVQAIFPGGWAPEAVRPFLFAAMIFAAAHAAMGLWQERVAVRPLRWAALPAAVPVVVLAIAFAQMRMVMSDGGWAALALVLAGALMLAARVAGDRQRAGAHAAGAVAAIALGLAMLLSDHWLTLAIALLLPALAWVEARADLPPLRHVALAVAAVVLIRLLTNWYVLDYPLGTMPVVNGLLLAYGVPALCFGLAAWLFRRRGEDALVGVLEAGAVAFVAALVALQIRHWATGGSFDRRDLGFLESALQVLALGVQAVMVLHLARRAARPVLDVAWRLQGAAAVAGLVLLVLANPAVTDQFVGGLPLWNALLPAYALPALLLLWALRQPELAPPPRLRMSLGLLSLVAGFVWLSLEVRRAFHPAAMGLDAAGFEDAELWAYSGAWLLFGTALMTAGIRFGVAPLRLAAIAVIGLTAAKAFLIDMSDLVGLWRVLSFLGLGLTLIALGAVYRRFGPRPAV